MAGSITVVKSGSMTSSSQSGASADNAAANTDVPRFVVDDVVAWDRASKPGTAHPAESDTDGHDNAGDDAFDEATDTASGSEELLDGPRLRRWLMGPGAPSIVPNPRAATAALLRQQVGSAAGCYGSQAKPGGIGGGAAGVGGYGCANVTISTRGVNGTLVGSKPAAGEAARAHL